MARRKRGLPINGWVIFNKPLHMSSNHAVTFVRRVFNAQKAGHAGTLDPLATGILPIALGEATKTMPYMLDESKVYRFTVTWGSQTDTDDLEGEVVKTSDLRPAREELEDVLPAFTGEITQIPPVYSALKIDGKRACDLVRAGKEVTMKQRQVTIHKLDILEFSSEKATFEAHVSKGTYIRSLARDIGEKLGCLGFVTMLERTKVQKFTLNQAVSKEKLDSCARMGQSAETYLLQVDAGLDDILVWQVTKEQADKLQAGVRFTENKASGLYRVVDDQGQISSLVEVEENGLVKVVRNFVFV